MKFLSTISMFILLIIVSCNDKRVDSRRFAQEMKNRELKHVNQGDIMNEALEKGQLLVNLIDTTFKQKLNAEMKKNGPDKAMQLCNIAVFAVKDSLSNVYRADIKRVNKSILQTGSKLEKELFDAYLYNEEQKLPMEDNLQDQKNGFILYTKAIVLNQEQCFNCHAQGNAQSEKLAKLFPQSPVFNLPKGKLMGMWSVSLSQQELIKKMK